MSNVFSAEEIDVTPMFYEFRIFLESIQFFEGADFLSRFLAPPPLPLFLSAQAQFSKENRALTGMYTVSKHIQPFLRHKTYDTTTRPQPDSKTCCRPQLER